MKLGFGGAGGFYGHEVKGSPAIYVLQPEAVAALIEQAAKSVKTSAAA